MGKLTFKGDPPVKKKKKSSTSAAQKRARLDGGEDGDASISGWVRIPSPELALGPTFITLAPTALTPHPLCIALQPTTGKIYAYQLPLASTSSASGFASTSGALALDQEELEAIVELPTSAIDAVGAEGPTDVHHVFVCTRVQDTINKVTFRSAANRFLACDEVGALSADREARGFQEEWTLEPASVGRGYVVRSPYGKLLSVDVVAGGKVDLRADEENESETSRWTLWMQAEYVSKARKAIIESQGLKAVASARGRDDGLTVVKDLKGTEVANIMKFQARGQGRLVDTEEDIRGLKKARKEGKLNEAMLDRRMKLKHDRYC